MRPGVNFRILHLCGHTRNLWLDQGDDWRVEELESRPCPICQEQAEQDAALSVWLAQEAPA